MKPFQPRLLRESRDARRWIAVVVAGGLLSAVLTIVLAVVLSRVLADAVAGHETLRQAMGRLLLVAALATGRGAVMYAAEYAGHLGAREVITALRGRLLHALADGGPAVLGGQRSGAVALAATTGIETLDVYFARYLPQLVLGAAIPTMVLSFLAFNDLLSAVIVLLTLPLIPIFMWLIGATAQHRMDHRWALLQRLGAYFLDVVQGLPTLRIFSRAEAQVERIRAVTEAARRATMGTLAVAFLSAMVMETLASIATALVAAEIGLRLVDGTMTLQTGLMVLIVVPEAYLPLRQLGTFFHSSTEGVAAATTVLDLAEAGEAGGMAAGTLPAPSLAAGAIELSAVTCVRDSISNSDTSRREGLLQPLTFSLPPGTTTLITGPSGAGKTTLLALLERFIPPSTGTIRVGDIDLRNIDRDSWRAQIGWVPQHPTFFAGTVLDNLRLGSPSASPREAELLLSRLFPDLRHTPGAPRGLGLDSCVTADGDGLSGGEKMRLALARALLHRDGHDSRSSPQLLLLDEPTAFLDPRSAQAVVSLLAEVATAATLVIATHEPERFPWATQIIHLDRPNTGASEAQPAMGSMSARSAARDLYPTAGATHKVWAGS